MSGFLIFIRIIAFKRNKDVRCRRAKHAALSAGRTCGNSFHYYVLFSSLKKKQKKNNIYIYIYLNLYIYIYIYIYIDIYIYINI